MERILQVKISDVPGSHKTPHDGYDFYKHNLVPREIASQCTVAVYEIMPGKSAVPYHYHLKNEETFYIISGSGELKTPDGCKTVSAGDFLFFPANENGAHKLTNTSETERLVYIDFDTSNDLDVALYPDSGKIGIWGKEVNQIYKTDQNVAYFEGE